MLKKNELRLLWPFYLTSFAASFFSVAIPVWIIFFQHKFTFMQISLGLTLQTAAAILLEVPTGALADIIGRKFSVISGITLQGLIWLCFPLADLPFLLYSAFFLMGAARTLESGADKAWIVAWLRCNKGKRLIQDLFIKIQSLNSLGQTIGALFTTLLLFSLKIEHLFFIQGCGYLLVVSVLFFFTRECIYREKTPNKRLVHNALCTSKDGIGFLFRDKSLRYLVLAASLAICSKDFGAVAWQPLLVNLTLPVEYLGIVFFIINSTGIITPFFSRKLLKKSGGENRYFAFTTLAEFIFLMSLNFIDGPFFVYGIIVYIFVIIITDLQSPVGSLYIQSLIPDKIRATTSSAESMIFAIFSSAGSIVGGYVMDRAGSKMSLIYFSLLLIPAAVFYLRIKNLEEGIKIQCGQRRRCRDKPVGWQSRDLAAPGLSGSGRNHLHSRERNACRVQYSSRHWMIC